MASTNKYGITHLPLPGGVRIRVGVPRGQQQVQVQQPNIDVRQSQPHPEYYPSQSISTFRPQLNVQLYQSQATGFQQSQPISTFRPQLNVQLHQLQAPGIQRSQPTVRMQQLQPTGGLNTQSNVGGMQQSQMITVNSPSIYSPPPQPATTTIKRKVGGASKPAKTTKTTKNEQSENDTLEPDEALPKDPLELMVMKRRLIDLVRDRPCLWNFHLEEHKDSSGICEQAWREIADRMELSGKEWYYWKAEWKKLRDYFKQILNDLPPSGSAYEEAKRDVKWKFFDDMEFLKDTFKPRKTDGSWWDNKANASVDAEDVSILDDSASTAPTPQSNRRNRGHRASVITPTELIPQQLINDFSAACNNLVKMSGAEEAPLRDPNAALGEMIVTEIGTYPVEQQRLLRREIRKAVEGVFENFN